MSTTTPHHNHLSGTLYALSLTSSTIILGIGLFFILLGTPAGPLSFGIPIPTSLHTSNILNPATATATASASPASDAYIAIIGVRDVTLSFLTFAFTVLRDRRGAGVAALGGIVATVGDGIVMGRWSERPGLFVGAHVVACVPLMALCYVLLRGGGEGERRVARAEELAKREMKGR